MYKRQDQYNVIPAGYEGESFAVGARKADKTLIKKINQGFRTLYKNGEFQKDVYKRQLMHLVRNKS